MTACRVCAGPLRELADFGRQPLAQAFVRPEDLATEFFYRLVVGRCADCALVQLMHEIPPDKMVHEGYPYHPTNSTVMHKHFQDTAARWLETTLTGPDPFVVEIGCNDGVVLHTLGEAGVRHLAVDPSGITGVQVHEAFFNAVSAAEIRAEHGPADIVYAANTVCAQPDVASIFAGLEVLLAPHGLFVFEDPYLGEVLARTGFDQIYDEHFYYFTAQSVQAMANRFGMRLVDVERIPVHGGQIRYSVARRDSRLPAPAVDELLAGEESAGFADDTTFARFVSKVDATRDALLNLLTDLRGKGHSIVGYGATAKSATTANYFGIGPDLVPFVCDSTPSKQGTLTPGMHIPVRPPAEFADPYPDYALLFAWNHADEIMAKEKAFRDAGGKWILYVPEVRIV
ncbi:class I SAM-dependent methyltransferase [Saccharothrix sp. NRRL B-16314]|uniref:class I SAM-dependent methyltransferase n=1 Tax=Saccharothrix sp. NRRL B-16314 TaxID=1463825 RepID=UPI000524B1FE|nr:class I SAM-dependent methyltransferase [Saccharothrix sp. NRRL B-16314]